MNKTVRNSSIDIFRYICAILVVMIHSQPFYEFNNSLGFICSQIIPRIAVPFFFATAGYFYINKLEKGQFALIQYLKRLLLTYSIWSIVYFIIDFIQWGHSNIKGYIVSCIMKFFIYGSSYHLWFFPSLVFSVLLTTFLWKYNKKMILPLSILLYSIGCLGCSYYQLGIQIPLLNQLILNPYFTNLRKIVLMGFPFFTCGMIIDKIKNKLSNQGSKYALVLSFTLWLVEIMIVRYFRIDDNIVVTVGLYPLVISSLILLLQNPLPKYSVISSRCRILANFTYYSHPLFMLLISTIIGDHKNTLLFALVLLITNICGSILLRLNKKITNLLIS